MRRHYIRYAATRWDTTVQATKCTHLTNSSWTRLFSEPISPCSNILGFEGAKRVHHQNYLAKLATHLCLHSVLQRYPHILYQTSSCPSKYHSHYFHMGMDYPHYRLNEKVEKEKWNGAILTKTTPRSELGWKIAVNTNSSSAVCIQRLDKWKEFLWHTTRWGAAPHNCMTDFQIEREILDLQNMYICSVNCRKVKI